MIMILCWTHFFYFSVIKKSFLINSFSRLYVEMISPMKRFIKKKFPMIMITTKKTAADCE